MSHACTNGSMDVASKMCAKCKDKCKVVLLY